MQARRVQLVIPTALHATWRPAQQGWLIDLAAFLALVRARQCD